jgi:predicted nucleic acid-binding protein
LAEIVVADASPMIALARIDQLALLPRIFSRAILPLAVYLETQSRPELPDASAIRVARDNGMFIVHEEVIQVAPGLLAELGAGEAAAISLALQMGYGVFMDEKAGRAAARALGLKTIGTLGVLSLARTKGFVTALRPLLVQLQNTGYYLGSDLVESALKIHGEFP